MEQCDCPNPIIESGTRKGKQEQALCLLDRKETIAQLTGRQFDILVIGGGITDTGIALDAASHGLKSALIEEQDFAAGISSRSTKLIHGGLHYLDHLELGLLHKAGREREILHQNSPHR